MMKLNGAACTDAHRTGSQRSINNPWLFSDLQACWAREARRSKPNPAPAHRRSQMAPQFSEYAA
jgi:hypothetical protein